MKKPFSHHFTAENCTAVRTLKAIHRNICKKNLSRENGLYSMQQI